MSRTGEERTSPRREDSGGGGVGIVNEPSDGSERLVPNSFGLVYHGDCCFDDGDEGDGDEEDDEECPLRELPLTEPLDNGLTNSVRDNDENFPPEWRLSKKGRAAPE